MPTTNARPTNRGRMSTRSKLSIFAFLFCLLAAVVSGAHCGGYVGRGGGGRGPRNVSRHLHQRSLSPVEELFWAHATPTYFKSSPSRRFSSGFSYKIHEDDDEITLTISLPGYSATSVDLSLTTKNELGSTERVLVVSPAKEEGGFAPTSFTIDSKVDADTITSSMKNGVLTVAGRKAKPEIETVALPIRVEEDEGEKEDKFKAEEMSPNDSDGVAITVDEDEE